MLLFSVQCFNNSNIRCTFLYKVIILMHRAQNETELPYHACQIDSTCTNTRCVPGPTSGLPVCQLSSVEPFVIHYSHAEAVCVYEISFRSDLRNCQTTFWITTVKTCFVSFLLDACTAKIINYTCVISCVRTRNDRKHSETENLCQCS